MKLLFYRPENMWLTSPVSSLHIRSKYRYDHNQVHKLTDKLCSRLWRKVISQRKRILMINTVTINLARVPYHGHRTVNFSELLGVRMSSFILHLSNSNDVRHTFLVLLKCQFVKKDILHVSQLFMGEVFVIWEIFVCLTGEREKSVQAGDSPLNCEFVGEWQPCHLAPYG